MGIDHSNPYTHMYNHVSHSTVVLHYHTVWNMIVHVWSVIVITCMFCCRRYTEYKLGWHPEFLHWNQQYSSPLVGSSNLEFQSYQPLPNFVHVCTISHSSYWTRRLHYIQGEICLRYTKPWRVWSLLKSICIDLAPQIFAIGSVNLVQFQNFKHQQPSSFSTMCLLQISMPYQPRDRCMFTIECATECKHALFRIKKTTWHWLNNDINLLGEKLPRQHKEKKHWNISAK